MASWQSKSAVTNIPTVPSVLPIKRTNHIDLRVCKNINQSEPEGQILILASAWKWSMKVRFKFKVTRVFFSRRFATRARRFAALSSEKKEKPLEPG